jgi:3-oxoacyl-[acyl-carrier protein] reductase
MTLRQWADDTVAEALGRDRRPDPVLPGSGGPAGNARLTAWTGLVLLALFAVELGTLLDLRPLLDWHVVVGVLLIPPALLKTASTGWRIVRYYTRDRAYRVAGPPPMPLRVLGPLVVLCTLAVLGTGVALVVLGPFAGRTPLFVVAGFGIGVLFLHKLTFVLWAVVTGVHTLGRLVAALRLVLTDRDVPGRVGRWLVLGLTDERRRVLVTGGSRGIGAAICRRFAAAGDRIAVHCRADKAAAESVRAELPGDGHTIVTADLGAADTVPELVDGVVAELGGIDVLVHNAGVFFDHPIVTTSYADWLAAWRRVLDVNLVSGAALAHRVVEHWLSRGTAGRIVLVGSRGAYRGEPDAPAYGASKAGLHALAQSLAVSLAPHGIGVAAVAPGFVRTDMAGDCLDGPRGDAIRAQSPFGRVAEPDEVAAAVAWLAAPESLWASGSVLDLNGASYLR